MAAVSRHMSRRLMLPLLCAVGLPHRVAGKNPVDSFMGDLFGPDQASVTIAPVAAQTMAPSVDVMAHMKAMMSFSDEQPPQPAPVRAPVVEEKAKPSPETKMAKTFQEHLRGAAAGAAAAVAAPAPQPAAGVAPQAVKPEDLRDGFRSGWAKASAHGFGGHVEQKAASAQTAEAADPLADLGSLDELGPIETFKLLKGMLKKDKQQEQHQEDGGMTTPSPQEEILHLGTDLAKIKKATQDLVGNLFNISQGKPIQDIIKKKQTEAKERRKKNLQRQLLGAGPGVRNEGRPASLLQTSPSEDAAAAAAGQGPDFSSARERIRAKIAAAKGKFVKAAETTGMKISASAAALAAKTMAADASAEDEEAEEGAAQEEGQEAEAEEEGDDQLPVGGHGEILEQVLARLKAGADELKEKAMEDTKAAMRNVTEAGGEPASGDFFADPASHVQVITNKFKKLGELIKSGIRSAAHDATKGLSITGMDGAFLSAVAKPHKNEGEE